MHRVKLIKGTGWAVYDPRGIIVVIADTNAAAWRIADRLNNEPISKAEDTADWIARKEANKE
jgi:hypothetical protein